ncbi:MAG: CoA transferase [Hyphomicrobiaceae bacterium]|nr:CoA transferase [Hyphomicrobiaceae bacterium]
MSSQSPDDVLRAIWIAHHSDSSATDAVTFSGADPVLPSIFPIGALAGATIAAAALAAAEVWRGRGGNSQTITVDLYHAAAEFRSERYIRTPEPPANPWDPIAGLYPTSDGRFVRIHTNFPHHRDGILALLKCAYDRNAVAVALKTWTAEGFETAAAQHNLVATMTRSPEDWATHSQGKAVAALPLIEVIRIGDAPPKPLPPATRPLAGVRVLDLTRIIAGPVAARTLAAHGADVLAVTSPYLPAIPVLVIDTGRGKRQAHIDLNTDAGRATLENLVRDADVFLQGYRPGGLAARGFSPERLATLNPGIICATLSAYGHTGPWSDRRGFDSLTQNTNGMNWSEALAAHPQGLMEKPKELPAQALDHGAGHLLAYGIAVALARRATEGGSWHVRTSLAQVGHFLDGLGRVPGGHKANDQTADDAAKYTEHSQSGFGPITAIAHAARLSATPSHYARPAMLLGTHPPQWE